MIVLGQDPETGLQLVEKLRDISNSAVLVVSGSSDGSLVLRAMRSGAKEFLTQPIAGEELIAALEGLEKYTVGTEIEVGDTTRRIVEVITNDGRKMIFDDNSWLMIRPSGTEPKVRFYVEARSGSETALLVETAKSMLAEIGLLA